MTNAVYVLAQKDDGEILCTCRSRKEAEEMAELYRNNLEFQRQCARFNISTDLVIWECR